MPVFLGHGVPFLSHYFTGLSLYCFPRQVVHLFGCVQSHLVWTVWRMHYQSLIDLWSFLLSASLLLGPRYVSCVALPELQALRCVLTTLRLPRRISLWHFWGYWFLSRSCFRQHHWFCSYLATYLRNRAQRLPWYQDVSGLRQNGSSFQANFPRFFFSERDAFAYFLS